MDKTEVHHYWLSITWNLIWSWPLRRVPVDGLKTSSFANWRPGLSFFIRDTTKQLSERLYYHLAGAAGRPAKFPLFKSSTHGLQQTFFSNLRFFPVTERSGLSWRRGPFSPLGRWQLQADRDQRQRPVGKVTTKFQPNWQSRIGRSREGNANVALSLAAIYQLQGNPYNNLLTIKNLSLFRIDRLHQLKTQVQRVAWSLLRGQLWPNIEEQPRKAALALVSLVSNRFRVVLERAEILRSRVHDRRWNSRPSKVGPAANMGACCLGKHAFDCHRICFDARNPVPL